MCLRQIVLFAPVLALIAGTDGFVQAQEMRRLLDLRGSWKFELGDDTLWARPGFDDRKWATVKVPGPWEEQGFPGYDGFAWYRKKVQVPPEFNKKRLYLGMGAVDDVDEVYVNGHFIGFQGRMPPDFSTAYGMWRHYPLSAALLDPSGEMVIAVRVYDDQQVGGITRGEPGIYEAVNPLVLDQSLEGKWKFHPGDDLQWKEPGFSDRNWVQVNVPAFWETVGFRGLDGLGWYRFKFRPDARLMDQRMMLCLGKIDDFDEVYLNGQRIGRTGYITATGEGEGAGDDYQNWRVYAIPPSLLHAGEDNIIAVRVFDRYMHGGIYEGPIGLVSRDKFLAWSPGKSEKDPSKNLQKFIDWLFK
jgi:sialate O-acetylesterase